MPRGNRCGRTNPASCAVATIFLAFLIAVIFIVYFAVFKPRNPQIAVAAVKFPAFSLSGGVVNFTCSQQVAVTNPNHDAFTHYDSSLELAYAGARVGFMFIPAGEIAGGQTKYMLATFAVQSFPVAPSGGAAVATVGGGVAMEPTMELESRVKMEGRVRVLRVFTHRVDSRTICSVVVEVSGGSVLGFHC